MDLLYLSNNIIKKLIPCFVTKEIIIFHYLDLEHWKNLISKNNLMAKLLKDRNTYICELLSHYIIGQIDLIKFLKPMNFFRKDILPMQLRHCLMQVQLLNNSQVVFCLVL